MKILILTTFPIKMSLSQQMSMISEASDASSDAFIIKKKSIYPISLSECKTRFEVYTYILYHYLNRYDDVELYISTAISPGDINMLKLKKYVYPVMDHVIFVENKGFRRRMGYVDKLRSTTKGLICSININSLCIDNEDICFYMMNQTIKHNAFFISCVGDPNLNYSNKTNYSECLNIIVQDTVNYDKLIELVNFIKKNLTDNKDIIDNCSILIKKSYGFETWSTDDIYISDTNYEMTYFDNATKQLKSYNEFYVQYAQTHIFFVTQPIVNEDDNMLLFELSMSNVLIVSPETFVDSKIAKQFNIYTYKTDINWYNIISQLHNYNIRDNLIENEHTWKNAVDKIYNLISKTSLTEKKSKTIKPKYKIKKPPVVQIKKINDSIGTKKIKDVINRCFFDGSLEEPTYISEETLPEKPVTKKITHVIQTDLFAQLR